MRKPRSFYVSFGLWLTALSYGGAERYFGRFIGLLAEGRFSGSKHFYSCRGFVWVPDKYRFAVSSFTFQPHLEAINNVTFWIGPKEPTGDIDEDLKPSANGVYLEPRLMAVQPKPYRKAQVKIAKSPPNPAELVYDEIMKYAKNNSQSSEMDWLSLNDNREHEIPKDGKGAGNAKPVIELLVSDGQTIQVTNPTELVEPMFTQRVQTSIAVSTGGNRRKRSLTLNDIWETVFKLVDNKKRKVTVAPSISDLGQTRSRTLQWHRGDQLVVLDLPEGRTVADFLWLAVYDHDRQVPVASTVIPNGPSFVIPEPRRIAGFRPAHKAYQAHTDAVELVDHKTIRIHNFSCAQCPPGTWIMAGKGGFPHPAGHILPLYLSNGTYDCEYLPAKVQSVLLTLHLPDGLTLMDITWIAAYNVPQKFSLGHVHIFDPSDIPAHLSASSVS